MRAYLLLFAMCLLLVGCSYSMSTYNVRNQNLSLIKAGKNAINVVLEKPGFDDSGSIPCRAVGPVEVPGGGSFSSYIANALKAELSATKLLNQESTNKLYVKVRRVDFSSALGATNWYIDTDYKIDGKNFLIATVYHDRSSYLGTRACSNIARYFQMAVGKHLRELYSRQEFRAAIGASQ